ncbi:unnamed protein product [Cochlearia groenlandica]
MLNNIPTCVRSIVGKTYMFRIKIKNSDFDASYQSFAVTEVQTVEDGTCGKKRQQGEKTESEEHDEKSDGGCQKRSRTE